VDVLGDRTKFSRRVGSCWIQKLTTIVKYTSDMAVNPWRWLMVVFDDDDDDDDDDVVIL
jgi:hypothetical protein